MLTLDDLARGPAYYVIGVRASGDRIVIDQAGGKHHAEHLRDRYRAQLEGYQAIIIEPAGEFDPPSIRNPHKEPRPMSPDPTDPNVPRDERAAANLARPPADVFALAERQRQIMTANPDSTYAQIAELAAAAAAPMTLSQWRTRRRELGQRGRPSGRPAAAPSAKPFAGPSSADPSSADPSSSADRDDGPPPWAHIEATFGVAEPLQFVPAAPGLAPGSGRIHITADVESVGPLKITVEASGEVLGRVLQAVSLFLTTIKEAD